LLRERGRRGDSGRRRSEARTLGARPVVVFTTAYGEHAVDAFDAAAADYLLRRVDLEKLARARDRAAGWLAAAGPGHEPRITARSGEVVRVFPARAIARFTAQDEYTTFVLDGIEDLIEEPLASLERRLEPWGFLRVHRAELVQAACGRAIHPRGLAAELERDDGRRVPVSRRLVASVRRRRRA